MFDKAQNLIQQQFGPIEMTPPRFLPTLDAAPLIALLLIGLCLVAAAFGLRYLIYSGVRLSGQSCLMRGHEAVETAFLWLAFAVGFFCGQVLFHNFVAASFCGGFFALACSGAVLEALIANSKPQTVRF
jgi:hypothetical protein